MTTHADVDTDPTVLDAVLATLAGSAGPLADTAPAARAAALRAVADALDAEAPALVGLARAETSLPEQRLTGELARATSQLRMFADGLGEGSWLDIIIDTADPGAVPVPRPDLRRFQVPLGPTLVFAASNFPFAFSVPGGDTASALAAGCPVVVKAHPGHPETSARTAAIVVEAWEGAGMPAGSFALVQGQQAGVDALRDPRINAGSFTGSLRGGRALFDIAGDREVPIPFYAEMGSLNPAFVSEGAVAARGDEIASGFVTSFTLGVGQFCTKPGLLFLPRGHGLTDRLVGAVQAAVPGRMLLDRIHSGHSCIRTALGGHPGMQTIAAVDTGSEAGSLTGATLLATDVPTLLQDRERVLVECFGPTSIVVEYDDVEQVLAAARAFEGNLTATIHAEPEEHDFARPLLRELRERAGRIVWNGWPTGVAVSWAMHHGGPYPATSTPQHTSVGMTAIRRFLRPVSYQDCPQELLPEVLRDSAAGVIVRRVDGRLTTGDVRRSGPGGNP